MIFLGGDYTHLQKPHTIVHIRTV